VQHYLPYEQAGYTINEISELTLISISNHVLLNGENGKAPRKTSFLTSRPNRLTHGIHGLFFYFPS
jgi:hypothetical protein